MTEIPMTQVFSIVAGTRNGVHGHSVQLRRGDTMITFVPGGVAAAEAFAARELGAPSGANVAAAVKRLESSPDHARGLARARAAMTESGKPRGRKPTAPITAAVALERIRAAARAEAV